MVRTNTLEAPGAGDAAVVRIKGTKRALALASDGNGRWCRLDPFVGAQLRRRRGRAQRGVLGREALGRDQLP